MSTKRERLAFNNAARLAETSGPAKNPKVCVGRLYYAHTPMRGGGSVINGSATRIVEVERVGEVKMWVLMRTGPDKGRTRGLFPNAFVREILPTECQHHGKSVDICICVTECYCRASSKGTCFKAVDDRHIYNVLTVVGDLHKTVSGKSTKPDPLLQKKFEWLRMREATWKLPSSDFDDLVKSLVHSALREFADSSPKDIT